MTDQISNNLRGAMRAVADALRLEEGSKYKEAYSHYLQCIVYIAQNLMEEAKTLQSSKVDVRKRYIQLGQKCMERIGSLAENIAGMSPSKEDVPAISPVSTKASPQNSPSQSQILTPETENSTSPGALNTSPQGTIPGVSVHSKPDLGIGSLQNTAQTKNTSVLAPTINLQPPRDQGQGQSPPSAQLPPATNPANQMQGPPSNAKVVPRVKSQSLGPQTLDTQSQRQRSLSPIEIAKMQNMQLMIAYRERMSKMQGKDNQRMAMMSLNLQRKLAENLALAKRRQAGLDRKIEERQQRLREIADRRFSGLRRPPEEQQREIYTKILHYEQETKWPLAWRDRLKARPQDASLIDKLVKEILSTEDHPLTILLKKYQHKISNKLEPIIAKHVQQLQSIQTECKVERLASRSPQSKRVPSTSPQSKRVPSTSPQSKRVPSTSPQSTRVPSTSPQSTRVPSTSPQSTRVPSTSPQSTRVPSTSPKSGQRGSSLSPQANVSPKANTPSRQSLSPKQPQTEDGQESDDIISKLESENANYINADETIGDVCTKIKKDLKLAMLKGDRLSQDIEDGKLNLDVKDEKKVEKEISGEYDVKDLDDLFDSDSEEITFESDKSNADTSMNATPVTDTTAAKETSPGTETTPKPPDKSKPADEHDSGPRPKIPSSPTSEEFHEMYNEALKRHLQNIAKDVHVYLDQMNSMFIVAYEDLDTPAGQDQCYASLEEPFFKEVWPQLFALFRLANHKQEIQCCKAMSRLFDAGPGDLNVPTKFQLGDKPYSSAVKELQSIVRYVCPLRKLECLVRVSRDVCECVDEYYTTLGKQSPAGNIGADDLLPILSYVIMKSAIPQLVSECCAMEEFIHEGYLMGEEGYCLTTIQTALGYVIKLSEPKETVV